MTRVLDPKHVETSDLLNPCLRLDPNMACSQYSFHCMVEQDLGPDAEYLKQWKEQETEPVDMEVEVETIDAESSPACAGAVTSNNQLFCSSSHGYLWNNHHQSSVPEGVEWCLHERATFRPDSATNCSPKASSS